MRELKLLLEKIGVAFIQMIDHEADDIIASFVEQNRNIYPHTVFDIFTRDKDLLQLVDEKVNILKYIDGKITLYTCDQFFQEYNFPPQNYLDYLSLLGDNVDNITGVKGIGPVSAKKLIQQFQMVENIYQKLGDLPQAIKGLLENNEDLVLLNKKLISLEKNISLEVYEDCNFD